ncbi:hypothetical protein L596_020710 [Steinernema carpocapsae]|nr:hypothetical protein L596_020710 [Steinernema carpocapsae]
MYFPWIAANPLYLRMLWILLTIKQFRGNECFFLLSQVGICNLIQISGQAIVGFTVLTSYRLFGIVDYVVIPVFACSWNVMLAMSFVLVVNRLQVICDLCMPKYTVTILAILAWLLGFFFFLPYVTRLCPLMVKDGYLLRDPSSPYSWPLHQIEFYSSIVLICFSLLIYICIILCVLYQRFKTTVRSTVLQTAELKLFLVALLEFLSCVCIDVCWCVLPEYLPDPTWNWIVINAGKFFIVGGFIQD